MRSRFEIERRRFGGAFGRRVPPARRWVRAAASLLALALAPIGASADCNCQDSDGDGFPDVNTTCKGTFAERQSLHNPKKSSGFDLTVRYTWDRELTCGQFVTGDYWVALEGDDHLELTRITPDYQGGSNGYMKNAYHIGAPPGADDIIRGQSFDKDASQFIAPPPVGDLDPEPGDVVLKFVSKEASLGQDLGEGVKIKPYGSMTGYWWAALTVLAEPPADSMYLFRPPYAGRFELTPSPDANTPGSCRTTYPDVDDATLAPCTRIGAVGDAAANQIRPLYDSRDIDWANFFPRARCASCQNVRTVNAAMKIYANGPLVELNDSQENKNSRGLISYKIFGSGSYGGDVSRDQAWTAILIASDQFDPNPVQRNAAWKAGVGMIQAGIDWIHMMRDGNLVPAGGGGHGGGYSLEVWLAAAALRHPDLMAFLASDTFRPHQGSARGHVHQGPPPAPGQSVYGKDAGFMSRIVNAGWFDYVRDQGSGLMKVDGGAPHLNNAPAVYGQPYDFRSGTKRFQGNLGTQCGHTNGTPGLRHQGTGHCALAHRFNDENPRGVGRQTHDQLYRVDGGGSAGTIENTQQYDEHHMCAMLALPVMVRLFPGGEEAWAYPEAYEYAMRKWRFGYWTLPDGFKFGGGSSAGKHGNNALETPTDGNICRGIARNGSAGSLLANFLSEHWNHGITPPLAGSPPAPDTPPPLAPPTQLLQ